MQEIVKVEKALEDISQIVRQYRGTAEDHEYLTVCLKLISETIKKQSKKEGE